MTDLYRWFPTGSTITEYPEQNAVVATYQGAKPAAIAYSGKRTNHDFHYTFYSTQGRDEYITKYLDGLARTLLAKTEKKARKKSYRHSFKVGDLLHYSWGYDQTNCEYYQVRRVSNASVWIRRIGSESVPGSAGFMAESVRPVPDAFLKDEPELRKQPQFYEHNGQVHEYLAMDHGAADKCAADEKHYSSWYA